MKLDLIHYIGLAACAVLALGIGGFFAVLIVRDTADKRREAKAGAK